MISGLHCCEQRAGVAVRADCSQKTAVSRKKMTVLCVKHVRRIAAPPLSFYTKCVKDMALDHCFLAQKTPRTQEGAKKEVSAPHVYKCSGTPATVYPPLTYAGTHQMMTRLHEHAAKGHAMHIHLYVCPSHMHMHRSRCWKVWWGVGEAATCLVMEGARSGLWSC